MKSEYTCNLCNRTFSKCYCDIWVEKKTYTARWNLCSRCEVELVEYMEKRHNQYVNK